jgi:hypothetical protein
MYLRIRRAGIRIPDLRLTRDESLPDFDDLDKEPP